MAYREVPERAGKMLTEKWALELELAGKWEAKVAHCLSRAVSAYGWPTVAMSTNSRF